mmetsp:Transcript_49318/g.120291  ORF Transcript_49318/g.120291 Transcript_49318/m.120291 type:complete len:212 (-) Transcript_49318:161-796(-)
MREPAPRPVCLRHPPGRGDGHASIPQVHNRVRLVRRLWVLGGQRRALQEPVRHLPHPQHQGPRGRRPVPRCAGHHRRPRRPCGAAALVQVRCDAAAHLQGRGQADEATADPHRDQGGARGGEADLQDHRRDRRHLRLHRRQHQHPVPPALKRGYFQSVKRAIGTVWERGFLSPQSTRREAHAVPWPGEFTVLGGCVSKNQKVAARLLSSMD